MDHFADPTISQYFTLPHILQWTPVDSTSKLHNTSFWITLDAGVWWSPLDSAGLQHLNHCCRLGLGLGFRLVLVLGLGVREVYIYCGRWNQQLSDLSLADSKKKMSHHVTPSFSGFFCPLESVDSSRFWWILVEYVGQYTVLTN